MRKLLSIIVPAYNMEKYLPNGLGSLVVPDADLLKLLDVIVVNDGSKDRTSEVAHRFAEKHPDVFRVVDKANGNYGSCINAALPMAQGRFVRILDADDSYDTEAFERYLHAIASFPETVDMVVSDWTQIDETGRVTSTTRYPFPLGVRFDFKEVIAHDCYIPMHSIAYRTALLHEIGYVQSEGISYTDTEWANIPLVAVRDICAVHEPVYRYLVGRAGQTVEPATFHRNVWMLDKILERMMNVYEEASWAPEARVYLQREISRLFKLSMRFHFGVAFNQMALSYLEWIRQQMRIHDFLVDVVHEKGRLTLISEPFRFHYVEFALRNPRLARLTLRAVMSYMQIRNHLRERCRHAAR